MIKKMKIICSTVTILLTGLVLAACGKQPAARRSQTASSTSSQPNYKLASSSVKLDSANLTPKQNAALVMFYAGVKNRQRYVRRMNKTDQHLSISLYNITDAKKLVLAVKCPGAQKWFTKSAWLI